MDNYSYEDDEGNKIAFFFNGDFSGYIQIHKIKTNEVNHVNETKEKITIPAKAILQLVAFYYVMDNKISKIENMDYKELLGVC